jgi:ATP/maltotriose-dependent transcriptional regulator MalT
LKRGIAIGSFGMGTLLDHQGRYGAALEAKTDALKIFDELKERTYTYAEILIGHGTSLNLAGRLDEANDSLDKGMVLAQELNNQSLIAQTLNAQGENALYRGDLKKARSLFEQASQTAARAQNRYFALIGRLNVAKVAAEEGRATAPAELRKLIAEADTRGLKQVSAEGSLHLGIALLNTRNAAGARAELSSALTKAERLGARSIMARGHYLLGEVERRSGNEAAAAPHQQQAAQILDEMQKEARSDTLLRRSDLNAIREAVSR